MNVPDEDRYKQIMRKLHDYAKEEFKRTRNIKRLTGGKKQAFDSKAICLADFFYWYRIKSNYRDLQFIASEDIPDDQSRVQSKCHRS